MVVWTTGDYRLPDRWESWKHDDKKITAPLDLHAVVIVGLEDKYIYINDPLTVKKAHKASQDIFHSIVGSIRETSIILSLMQFH